MRLWSLHPRYLDTRGLVACWREGLLARKVLRGETRGYRNHPQLERFRAQEEPVPVLDRYLLNIFEEATKRGFSFNREKIGPCFADTRLVVTRGQLEFEWRHLKAKLKIRDGQRHEAVARIASPIANPIFRVIEGDMESWEKGG